MDTLIIGNQSEAQIRARFKWVLENGESEDAARLDFVSLDDAWKILSDKRRGILQIMAGQGPLAIREIARRAGRDVRAVHSDVRILQQNGVLDRMEDGRMELPYSVIKFDFTVGLGVAA
jgi:predicted transcriptional regulator